MIEEVRRTGMSVLGMSALRASIIFVGGAHPDLTVGAITSRCFALIRDPHKSQTSPMSSRLYGHVGREFKLQPFNHINMNVALIP